MSALAGKRIVNTRAEHQAGELDERLHAAGALPLAYPCIAIVPPTDMDPLDDALRAAVDGAFDWLVLTSANVVAALAERLDALGAGRLPAALRTAAVGAGTAAACVRSLGHTPVAVPGDAVAEALLAGLPAVDGARVLLPQGDLARPLLAEGLTDRGAAVTAVTAYRTVRGSGGVDLPRLLDAGRVDAAACTSPSTVYNLIARVETEGGSRQRLQRLPVACIGPVTAAAAEGAGLSALTARPHSLDGLIEALNACLA